MARDVLDLDAHYGALKTKTWKGLWLRISNTASKGCAGVNFADLLQGISMISRAATGKPALAAAVAAITSMVALAGVLPSGDLQIGAFEAAPTSASAPAAKPKFAQAPAQANAGSPPQIDPNPTLAEEAPHIVPVLPSADTSAAPQSQPGLPEDAPHIVPVVPEAPGNAPKQVPAE